MSNGTSPRQGMMAEAWIMQKANADTAKRSLKSNTAVYLIISNCLFIIFGNIAKICREAALMADDHELYYDPEEYRIRLMTDSVLIFLVCFAHLLADVIMSTMRSEMHTAASVAWGKQYDAVRSSSESMDTLRHIEATLQRRILPDSSDWQTARVEYAARHEYMCPQMEAY